MSKEYIELCHKIIAYESVIYKELRDEGKAYRAEMAFQSKTGMERLLAALLAHSADRVE